MQQAPVDQKSFQKEIKRHFDVKDKEYFSKNKPPKADCYPIVSNDPYLVLENPRGYESLFLVGRNWSDAPDKPIALVYGCNNWKLGFLSEYLSDYRTAFIPRKYKKNLQTWNLLRKLTALPDRIFIWSYTENFAVRHYSKTKNIPISRIEDGFLRSSSLGASHSTPLSLVIDDKDLFFNSSAPSKLEDILNNYNFSEDSELIEKARVCLNTLLELKLSKYNNPEFIETNDKLNLRLKRKVGVLGQVDNDAAIRLGNPDGWSFEDLVRLAAFENPDAEIVYRPHPEVYRGYQENKLKKAEISRIATISPPEGPLWDYLDELDQVYTISSLSGFEALIRGIKVTTVGIPFYGGWGLTDDRAQFERRNNTRSLEEAFAAIYLLYPTYLSNKDDSFLGFLTACYAIKADQEIELNHQASEEKESKFYKSNLLWAKTLLNPSIQLNEKETSKIIRSINWSEVFDKKQKDAIFQVAFSLIVLKSLKSNSLKFDFINRIKHFIAEEAFSELVNRAKSLLPLSHLNSLHASYLSRNIHSKSTALDKLNNDLIGSNESNLGDSRLLKEKDPQLLQADLETYISLGLNDQALETAFELILTGNDLTVQLQNLIRLSDLLLDFESTLRFAKVLQATSLKFSNRLGTASEVKASLLTAEDSRSQKMLLLAKTLKLKPELYGLCQVYLKQFPDTFDENIDTKILNSLLYVDNDISYRKALGYIAAEDAPKACQILEQLIIEGDRSAKLAVTYSQALSYSNRLDEANIVITQALEIYFIPLVIHEYLRICILRSQYNEALDTIHRAESRGVEVGDMHLRKVYFGNRMVEQAFETFTHIRAAKALHKYFPEKYIFTTESIPPLNKVILLSLYGPGDEIRFASIYKNLRASFAGKELTISATPRLIPLFERSFPEITFIPVDRPRKTDRVNVEEYNELPGSDIIDIVDNATTKLISEYDGVALATDFLHRYLKSYESFARSSYLQASSSKIAEFQQQLPQDTTLVGISWRSSLTTHSRNEHYLTAEQLLPLFEHTSLTFINLQYDECDEELAFIEEQYPGRLINLPEVDQYNDFDSVAALMSCMDLIISPATTVVELAGALGIPTWLFANSSEIHWRRIKDTDNDVWHGSCQIVEGKLLGNHQSLVEALTEKLISFEVHQ